MFVSDCDDALFEQNKCGFRVWVRPTRDNVVVRERVRSVLGLVLALVIAEVHGKGCL